MRTLGAIREGASRFTCGHWRPEQLGSAGALWGPLTWESKFLASVSLQPAYWHISEFTAH